MTRPVGLVPALGVGSGAWLVSVVTMAMVEGESDTEWADVMEVRAIFDHQPGGIAPSKRTLPYH